MLVMYTEEFKKKLSTFEQALHDLENKVYSETIQSSPYSKKMIRAARNIVSNLLKYNDTVFWQDPVNQNKVLEELAIIDFQQGAHLPVIFNQQSLELAELFLTFLKNIDQDKDFVTAASFSLSLVSGNDKLKKYIYNLEVNIKLYKDLLLSHVERAKLGTLRHQFKTDVDKLETDYKSDFENQFANDERYATFLTEYQSLVQRYLTAAADFEYLCMFTGGDFIKSTKPSMLDPNDVFSGGLRLMIIKEELLETELIFNQKLPPNKRVYSAYLHAEKLYDPQQAEDFKQSFKTLIKKYDDEITTYKKGTHLNILNTFSIFHKLLGPDPNKVAILEKLSTDNNGLVSKYNSYSTMETYKNILIAQQKHYKLMGNSTKQLSSGGCGELLNNMLLELQDLFYSTSEKNDILMGEKLDRYRRMMELPELAVTASRTRSNSN